MIWDGWVHSWLPGTWCAESFDVDIVCVSEWDIDGPVIGPFGASLIFALGTANEWEV